MSLLFDYNPLNVISLPGADIMHPEGVIVVVGPNSSGKTLFLRDIERYLHTGKPDFVVCRGISTKRPDDFQVFVDDLLAKNYLQTLPGQDNQFRTYVPFMKQKENGAAPDRNPFAIKTLKKSYDDFVAEQNGNNSGWFGNIGITLAALLSLNQRRSVCNKTASFDYKQSTPDHPVQGLFVNSDAQERLAKETGTVFGNAVWLDISESGIYQLRVSGTRKRPLLGEMINPLQARHYNRVESEGDGYQSYVGICLSLLLAIRPVSLIDEPELCLHPPQAHHIGRFIGQHAPKKHVTVVATHSSHVLRGILETGEKVTVVRLTRRGKKFSARLIAERELVDNLRNPRTRAESILDGVFSKGVVLVESEGDREEYQAAAEAIEDFPAREVHFVPVGGTGGFIEPLRFYQSLEIPVAIVADLDAVCDTDKLTALSPLLAASTEGKLSPINRLRSVVQKVKSLPPPISETEAKEALRELSESLWDWNKGDDNVLRRRLNELVGQLKRVQRLKEGGIAAYLEHPEIHEELIKVIAEYELLGLFFVPVGELEDWVVPLMKDAPRAGTSKTERAAVAANRIREAENKAGDIWEFIQKVFNFIQLPDE